MNWSWRGTLKNHQLSWSHWRSWQLTRQLGLGWLRSCPSCLETHCSLLLPQWLQLLGCSTCAKSVYLMSWTSWPRRLSSVLHLDIYTTPPCSCSACSRRVRFRWLQYLDRRLWNQRCLLQSVNRLLSVLQWLCSFLPNSYSASSSPH